MRAKRIGALVVSLGLAAALVVLAVRSLRPAAQVAVPRASSSSRVHPPLRSTSSSSHSETSARADLRVPPSAPELARSTVPRAPSPADDLVRRARELPDEELAESRQLLRDALVLDPKNRDALYELSGVRLEDEDYDEAIALANRCLEVSPDDDECGDIRSMALGRSGRQDVDADERALAKHPNDFGALQGVAQARIAQGRLAEAAELIAKMRALQPENPLVLALEGDLALRQGDGPRRSNPSKRGASSGRNTPAARRSGCVAR